MPQNFELRDQSRGRDLTKAVAIFATALEAIYATGVHDFQNVVTALNTGAEPLPSGRPGPWTLQSFEAELREINASLDAAYAEHGFGA